MFRKRQFLFVYSTRLFANSKCACAAAVKVAIRFRIQMWNEIKFCQIFYFAFLGTIVPHIQRRGRNFLNQRSLSSVSRRRRVDSKGESDIPKITASPPFSKPEEEVKYCKWAMVHIWVCNGFLKCLSNFLKEVRIAIAKLQEWELFS